ncbi:integrase/recombinase xerD homolog [Pleurodeles waltl]|uniref:integrase/recombinase xerD homolog n=1 Tax=Pleurodeles waltl TaxID=8319 RepID=UPI0037097808
MVSFGARSPVRFPSPNSSSSGSSPGPSGVSTSVDSTGQASSGSLENLRRHWFLPGISEQAAKFILQAWSPGTLKRYASAWKRWSHWCAERSSDPFSADVSLVINFLASLAASGLAFRSINNYRSAISAGHSPVQGKPVGEHNIVCKLIRGIRLSNPPRPRYTSLWDVNVVLTFISSWPDNELLSRKQLSAKLTLLLCLISCKRVSDVRSLDLQGRIFSPSGVIFSISKRTKTGTSSASYTAFPHNPKLCVVQCLKAYEAATEKFRADRAGQLLIAIQKPFKPVSSATLARWIRWLLSEAGIDVSMFGAHSVWGAMASKSFSLGMRLEDIMRAADWSSESTFKTFYHKPIVDIASIVVDQL